MALMNAVSRVLVITPEEKLAQVEQALRHVATVPRLVTLQPAIYIVTRYLHERLNSGGGARRHHGAGGGGGSNGGAGEQFDHKKNKMSLVCSTCFFFC